MTQPTAEGRMKSALKTIAVFAVLAVVAAVFVAHKAFGAEDTQSVYAGYVIQSTKVQVATLNTCALATIAYDNTVIIDWECVDKYAQQGSRGDYLASVAIVLQALRDGNARSK